MTTGPELDAARLLLRRLGVEPEQLLGAASHRTVPTFDEYIPQVASAVPDGTHRVYASYWNRVQQIWGSRTLDEPTPLEITQLAEHTKRTGVVRRNSRGGRSAAEHLIGALRCVYRHAEHDGFITRAANPALRVPKPRRLTSTRRALPDSAVDEINEVAARTGNDPELDTLLLRLHEETAGRRGGAIALGQQDLDSANCLLRLREKGHTVRWQPISPTLTRHLEAHTRERNTGDHSRLLFYRDGRPLTSRRYDYLWARIGEHLPWVARQQITTHWLRHTTLTWVERRFGYAVARAYAGHSGRNDAGVTTTYVRADLHEVANALAALTGEPHPLAGGPHSHGHHTAPSTTGASLIALS